MVPALTSLLTTSFLTTALALARTQTALARTRTALVRTLTALALMLNLPASNLLAADLLSTSFLPDPLAAGGLLIHRY